MSPDDAEFGKKVRAARRAREMTQVDLGQRVNKNQHWVSMFERGYVAIDDAMRERLVRVLGLK